MKSKSFKLLLFVLIIAIFGVAVFFAVSSPSFMAGLNSAYRDAETIAQNQFKQVTKPCSQPIGYHLGQVDSRFRLGDKEIRQDMAAAVDLWNQAAGEPLLEYQTSSVLTINLVYDYRQAMTDQLKKLGITVEHNRTFYDQLKAKYDQMNAAYLQEKASIGAASSALDQKQADYNATVASWNSRGGAPANVYDQLRLEQSALNDELVRLNNRIAALNASAADLNAVGDQLNQLIAELNLNVRQYNTTGQQAGRQFEEGVYSQDSSGKRIDVYEFDSQARLVRLLAHEFGHALGLNHTSGTADIMYYLNQGSNEKMTAGDIKQISNLCGLNK